MQRPRNEAAFAEMVSAFNAGAFYRCHEIIEDELWRPLPPGDEKRFYQGVLQVAVGYHHWQRGNDTGARSLLGKGLQRLTPLQHQAPFCNWVDLARLVSETALLLARLEQAHSSPAPSTFPQLWH